MKWGHGEEGCVLTLGGLMDMRDSSRNRTCECPLNHQKSAEAKVPNSLEYLGRAESFKKNYPFAYATLEEAETLSFLMEEMVNPVGNIRRAERCCHTRRTIIHVGVRYHVGKLIRRYLQAGIMENGLVKPNTEGTPQGGP